MVSVLREGVGVQFYEQGLPFEVNVVCGLKEYQKVEFGGDMFGLRCWARRGGR